MTHRNLRVALLGYGFAGRTFHAPLLGSVDGLTLHVVASSDREKVSRDLGPIAVETDPFLAVRRPDIDVVVIATPNETHATLAHAALEAGKHVVVDKPFTVTIDEARRLDQTANRRARVLSVFQNRRWDSDFLSLKYLISEGTLGRIVEFESSIDRFRPEVRQRWREQNVPGGGLLFDLGPHLVDQALQLFGIPIYVTASIAAQRDDACADDWFHVVLEYGSTRVILRASMLAAGHNRRFEVRGVKGTWIKQGMDTQEESLRCGGRPGLAGWGDDPSPGKFHSGSGNGESTLAVPGDYAAYYAALRNAICGQGSIPVPALQGIAVMAVIEAAVRSARNGKSDAVALTSDERLSYATEIALLLP